MTPELALLLTASPFLIFFVALIWIEVRIHRRRRQPPRVFCDPHL